MNEYLLTTDYWKAETREAVLRSHAADCRVCMGAHDDEIHDATLAVRSWFRDEVTKSFQPLVLF